MASSRSVYTAAAKPPAPRRRPKQRAVVVKVGLPGPEGFAEAFQQAAGAGAVVLPLARVPTLLQALGLAPGAAQLAAALQSLGSSGRTALGRDDAAVLCQMLAFGSGCSSSQASSPMRSLAGSPLQAAAAAASEAGSSGDGGGARACLRSLSRQRSTSGYEATGRLCTDDAVVGFVVALDEHRKKCELTGRYAEAAAAAARIAALKTAQAERLRSELVELQQGELERLQGRYFVVRLRAHVACLCRGRRRDACCAPASSSAQRPCGHAPPTMRPQETADFDQEWRGRVASYEADVAGQVAGLKAAQEQQLLQLLVRCEARRPGKPQHRCALAFDWALPTAASSKARVTRHACRALPLSSLRAAPSTSTTARSRTCWSSR